MRPVLRPLLLLVLLLLGLGVQAQTPTLPLEGRPAPALDATLLDGGNFTLEAARGEVVLVTFWATWCGPCRHEMPVLDAFYRRYRGKGLRVLAVSVDDPFAEATVRQFMAPYALPLALLHDTHALNYGKISRIPSSFLIDRRGILRRSGWFSESANYASDLERVVTPLLRTDGRMP
jgi:cytochrome c biogenesis protein CcmG/thiol:disulfide interchange protein DsbE